MLQQLKRDNELYYGPYEKEIEEFRREYRKKHPTGALAIGRITEDGDEFLIEWCAFDGHYFCYLHPEYNQYHDHEWSVVRVKK